MARLKPCPTSLALPATALPLQALPLQALSYESCPTGLPNGLGLLPPTNSAGQLLCSRYSGENRVFDAAWGPGFRLVDEGVEEIAAEGADVVGALGVPLDGEDEVVTTGELYGLDDAVFGGDRGDDEVVAGGADGLVVAGVDAQARGRFVQRTGKARFPRRAEFCGITLGGGIGGRHERGEAGVGGDLDGMGF